MSDTTPATQFASGLIGSLAIALSLAAAPAWADNAPISIDDITMDIGFAKYTAKHLNATGTNLSATELKTLFTHLSLNSADELAKLDAVSISIPDLEFEQSLGQIHQLAHYHDVKLENIHGGKVGSYSIAGAEIHGDIGNGQTIEGKILPMGGTDTDLPGLIRLFSQTGSPEAPLKPLYGTAYGDGYTFKTPMLEFSVGKATMSDIRGRPLTHSLSDIFSNIPPQPKPGQTLSAEDQKAAMAFMMPMFDMCAAFSVGKAEMHDLKISTSGDPLQHFPAFTMQISRVTMSDYANSRLGEFSIEGLDVTPALGKFHLGNITLKGLDFRDSMVSMTKIMQKMADANSQPGQLDPADLQMKSPKITDFMLHDLAADFSMSANPNDPTSPSQPIHISLAAYDLKPVLADNGLPKSLSSSFDHLIFSVPPNMPVLLAAGVDSLDLSSKFDAQWDAATQHLTIGTAMIEGAGLGKATVAASADNIPPEAFSGDQFIRQAAWLGAVIKSADVRLDNEKLMDLVIASQVKQTGKSIDDVKSDLITAASVGIPGLLGDTPGAKALADAVAKFLANPKSLHIVTTSTDGVGVGDLMAPAAILDKVQLTATANQ